MVKTEINVWVISEILNRMGSSAIEFEDNKAGLTGARLARAPGSMHWSAVEARFAHYGRYLAVSPAPASSGPLRAQA